MQKRHRYFWNYQEKYFGRKGINTFEIIRRNIFAGNAQILLKLSGEIFLQERQYWEDASPLHFRLLQMCRREKRDILTSQIIKNRYYVQNLNLLQNKLFWLNNKWVLKDEYFIRFTLRCIHAVLDIPLKCPKKWISLPIDISK